MKNFVVTALIVFSYFWFSPNLFAQLTYDIHHGGDRVKYLGNKYKWQPDNPFFETNRVFSSFGPNLVSAYYKNDELDFFKYNAKEGKYIKTTRIAKLPIGGFFSRPMLLEYDNMNFVITYNYDYKGNNAIRIYRCADNSFVDWECLSKYNADDMPDDSLNYYEAAFAYGGKIYLAYNSYFKHGQFSDEKCIIERKDIYVDECIIKDGRLKVDTTYHFKDAIFKDRFMIKTMTGFKHRDGNLRLIVSYYVESILVDDDNRSNENKGGGVTILNLKNGTAHNLYRRDDFICSIDAMTGSIKARKKSDKYSNETFRIQLVFNHLKKHTILRWQNKGHLYYRTYTYDGNGYKPIRKGKIINHEKALPTSNYKMYLQLIPRFIPSNIMDDNRNNDVVKKEIWLMHTGKHGGLWANIFYSDQFKPDPSTYVFSVDLMDDKTYGPSIRSLWTLIGITEGAPPVSMDWNQWKAHHLTTTHPSTLMFSRTDKYETSVTSTFSRSWYNQFGVGVGNKDTPASGSIVGRYTNAYNKSKVKSLTNEIKMSEVFYSSENTQDSAYLIWQIPSVYRIEYAIYPWWDNNLDYSLDSSKTFLFYSLSNTLVFEKRGINEKPFCIQNANDSTFSDWKLTNKYRDTIVSVAGNYSIPALSISWTNNGPGATNHFVSTTTKTISTSEKNQFSITASASRKLPKTFELSTSHNLTWSYQTTVSNTTSISKAVEISMAKLENKQYDGAKMNSIYTNAYFFKPTKDRNGNSVDWWYYKYFPKHHPWYITYVVDASSKISVISPKENGILRNNKSFSWTHNTKDKFDYTVLFCKDEFFGPANSIEMPVGNNLNLQINNEVLQKFPTDSIIYWVVKAKNQNKYSWSKIHWFIIPKKTTYNQAIAVNDNNRLNFLVYPNPVSGNYVNVAFKSNLDNDWVNIEWISLNGNVVYSKDKQEVITDGCLFKVDIPKLNPGVYFLRISTPTSSGVGKVVLTN